MTAFRGISVCLLLALAACSAPAASPRPAASPDPAGPDDAIRLTSGETVRGRILEETARHVILERENVVSSYPRAAIFSIDYAKDRWMERKQSALTAADPGPAAAQPSATWLPRTDPGDPVQQTEVLFYDTHGLADCVGPALSQAHAEFPDLRLFVEPGGRIVLHDPKQWGYHAHLPGGALRIPAGKPGLSIDVPRDENALPESVSFVSPAQEIRAGDAESRSSYALPDAVCAMIKPLSLADTMLALQPFAGGRPAATANGSLWAFTLPRNSRQFFVYLLDRTRKHGEILKAAYVGYGETILAADLLIDVMGADGVALGRVLAVPFPDNLSADGPAREPLTVYAGPVKDPTAVVTLAMPPREAVQLPPKAAATKADVLVSHYEVSAAVPQCSVLAYGTGRPTKDVTISTREITPKEPDQIVKIDVSSLPEERFPAVVWLYQRRTYAWKTTGGRLPKVPEAVVPPRGEPKLGKLKRSDAIPHVLPLLFTGPKPAAARAVDPAASVAGGMANGLLRDALLRESGGMGGNPTLSLAPAPGVAPVESSPNVSNVTYVYITSPPHTPAMEAGPHGGPSMPGGHDARTPDGGPAMATSGTWAAGTHDPRAERGHDRTGPATYDPSTGTITDAHGTRRRTDEEMPRTGNAIRQVRTPRSRP